MWPGTGLSPMLKMKLLDMLPFRALLLCLSLAVMSTYASGPDSGLTQEYCSSENTGDDYSPVYNTYNSNGACFTNCQDQYAFAIVQGHDCWCSNYIPAEQQSVGDCNVVCPGYGSEFCGNQNSGLFGYVKLDIPPAGTAGASSQTTSPSPTSAISTPTPTSSSSYLPTSVSSSSSPSSTASAVTSVRVTTISGAAVTQTVTSTPLVVSPSDGADAAKLSRQGISRGAVAGIVVGSLLGLAAILLGAFLLYRRKKKEDAEGGSTVGKPKRGGSVLSRTGLLGRERPQSMSEHGQDDPYIMNQATRSNSARHSMMFGAGAVGDGVSPASALGGGSHTDAAGSRRHSKPRVHDQRLNPSAIFMNLDNGSRVSIQDQQDYSRPLGIVNPDYRGSFDSR